MFFFPSSKRRRTTDEAMVIQRTEVLAALSRLATTPSASPIVVTYPEALSETVPAKNELSAISFQLSTGQEIAHSALSKQLLELGFEQVDFVFQPGQYAIRGSIVDIYSYSHDIPYRLDFFGDEIDSIREFDIEDQLSKTKVEKAEIVGAQKTDRAEDAQSYITDYLTDDFIWVSNDWSIVRFKLDGLGVMDSIGAIETHKTIELNEKSTFPTHSKITLDIVPQPLFHKQFDLLTEDIRRHMADGYKIYILAEQKKQLDRLKAIFEAEDSETPLANAPSPLAFIGINATLHEGFVDHGLKICCYTDHQIFERYHRVTLASENARRGKAIITLREINQLQIGDYVVHADHGIARFETGRMCLSRFITCTGSANTKVVRAQNRLLHDSARERGNDSKNAPKRKSKI